MPDSDEQPSTDAAAVDVAAEAPVEQAAPAEEAAPVETDPVREALLDELRGRLGDGLVGAEIAAGDLWVRVANGSWKAAGEACKALGFDYFCFLSGIDWMPNPGLSGRAVWDVDGDPQPEEEAGSDAIETGRGGGDTRFQVFARLYSLQRRLGITLKADLDPTTPSVESWVTVYRGADWHERETWEMYGFEFLGHPGMRHLYLPKEFEGFPLRKDFPLLSREVKPWPGLVDKEPMPGEGDGDDAGGDAAGAEAAPAEEGSA